MTEINVFQLSQPGSFANPFTPEERREMLADMDQCPCCERWIGHNRPPADDSEPPLRRQTTFEF